MDFVFETRSHYVALADLELSMYARLAWTHRDLPASGPRSAGTRLKAFSHHI